MLNLPKPGLIGNIDRGGRKIETKTWFISEIMRYVAQIGDRKNGGKPEKISAYEVRLKSII